MARAHLYMLAVDEEGNLLKGAEVRLLQPNSTNPITVPVYESNSGSTTMGNPWSTESGVIDVYLDSPARVRIGIKVGNSVEQYIENIDVGSSGDGEGDNTHTGTGEFSTAVGMNAQSSGAESVAVGNNSLSALARGTAVGRQAIVNQAEGTAIGWHAQANADGSFSGGSEANATGSAAVALGKSAEANGSQSVAIGRDSMAGSGSSVAIGYNANASHSASVALGPGSQTTNSNQITLGTSDHETYVPGILVMRSAGGMDYGLRILDNGSLYSVIPSRDTDNQILPTGDQAFTGGVGGWTATGSTLSITTDNSLSPAPLLTVDTAQGSTAVSSTVTAQDGLTYVASAWVYATGDFTVSLAIEFLDGGSSLSASTPVFYPSAEGQWIEVSTQGAAPTNTDGVRLRVTSDAGASEKIYIESADLYQRT